MEELLVDLSEKLFHKLVDYKTDGRVVFSFRNGEEVSRET